MANKELEWKQTNPRTFTLSVPGAAADEKYALTVNTSFTLASGVDAEIEWPKDLSSDPLESGYNGDYTIDKAGTFGPNSSPANVNGSIYIQSTGVILQNLTITGNLTFGAGIGSGDAYINNVTVMGNTTVNGGGSNSLHIQGNSKVGNVLVNDNTGTPRIVNEDASELASIEVKTPVTIEDNSITSPGILSNIGYIKADNAGLTTISGTNANGLIENTIAKAQYFIDNAYQDKNNHTIKDLYASIEMLNNDTNGIHSLKKYLFPLENTDDTNVVPASLQASYTLAQDAYLQLWSDWNSTFPLLYIVKNTRDLNQSWITRSGQYALAIAEQQYMLNASEDLLTSSGSTDAHSYIDNTLDGQPITVENVGSSLTSLQNELIKHSFRVTDSAYVSKSPSEGLVSGDKVTIEFKYGNITNWDAAVNSISTANSANFTAAAGTDHNTSVNIAGTAFNNVTLKEIVLTATKNLPAGTTITIPKNTFDLGAVDTMIGGSINDVKGPAMVLQIPLVN